MAARKLMVGVAILAGVMLSFAGNALPVISVFPENSDYTLGEGGGTELLAVDVVISNIQNGTPGTGDDSYLSAYDIGLIYDPAVLSFDGFDGFSNNLGSGGQVINAGPADPSNDQWLYTDDSPAFGAYSGPVLGAGPVDTGAGTPNEGSLRFAQLSFLSGLELAALQTTDSFILFSLTFEVDTSTVHSSALLLVDDSYYAGFTGDPDMGLLDQKYNDSTDSSYATLRNASVSVAGIAIPEPGVLPLWAVGLLGLWLGTRGVYRSW